MIRVPIPRERRVRASLYVLPGFSGICRTGARKTHPARLQHQRARRVHGKGPEAARRQPSDARAIRPRRKRASRGPRPGADAGVSAETRVHMVRPRRSARPQPGPFRRRRRRRRRREKSTRRVGRNASASRLERKDEKEDRQGAKEATARAATPTIRRPSGASPFPRPASCRKPISWTSSSSRATTISPAANNSTGSRCCESSTTRQQMFNDSEDESDKNKSEPRTRRRTTSERSRARKSEDREQERELEQRIERQMNKTALVTLWVDPAEHRSSSTPSTTSGWTFCREAGSSRSTTSVPR